MEERSVPISGRQFAGGRAGRVHHDHQGDERGDGDAAGDENCGPIVHENGLFLCVWARETGNCASEAENGLRAISFTVPSGGSATPAGRGKP